MNIRRMLACVLALTVCLGMSGCGEKVEDKPAESTQAQDDTAAASEEQSENSGENGLNAVFGEIRTEYNTALDLSDYPLTPNDVPSDFKAVYEAEYAELTGNAKAYDGAGDMASNGGYVDGLNSEGDSITFKIELENSGFYKLNFPSMSSAERVNYVCADGEQIGEIVTIKSEGFVDTYIENVYLSAGEHEIQLLPFWGYCYFDCLELTRSDAITDATYNVTKKLSNPNADENTQRMYKFLCDIYGKYSLAGQYADKARESSEYEKIQARTGKAFAVLGMDMMNYSLGAQAHGTDSRTIEYAYDWYTNAGGIVQLCWHWNSPEDYQVNNSDHPWYSSFYKEASKLNLDYIMSGKDEKGYQALMDDIDHISEELARLRDAGVPVLWRPLHEASGGWFWWGDCEPESYKKLWNVMYDKMTNEHDLTNLIWIWNGQDMEWYPGDETVDIVGWDIYAGNHVYSAYSGRFADMANNYGEEAKLIALTENGCVMDPDNTMNDNARWLFWGTWSDPFTMKLGVVLNDEYTELEILDKAYQHERVLTLDELPDLKTYPLE